MEWEVRGSRRVAKLLERFNRGVHERYDQAFEQLAAKPESGKLLQGYEELRSFPITTPWGEHRIIYRLKPEERVVYVILVGKRESVYELLKRSGRKA